jgi:hypothetical protein
MFERAVNNASKHCKNQRPDLEGAVWSTSLYPWEVEEIILGEDRTGDRFTMTIKIAGDSQFSFLLDRGLFERIRAKDVTRTYNHQVQDTLQIVADDIEYFQRNWCNIFVPLTDVELRWGVPALRRLLVNGVLGNAWRQMGFANQPQITAPDAIATLKNSNTDPNHIASFITGGACVSGVEFATIGVARVFNATTGIGPGADGGFAVETFMIARDARHPSPNEAYGALITNPQYLSNYLESVSAIRRGILINRREIIQYFAKVGGGVHLDTDRSRNENEAEKFALIAELQGKVAADVIEGLYFELLSIGQAIGKSEDVIRLKDAIKSRRNEKAH